MRSVLRCLGKKVKFFYFLFQMFVSKCENACIKNTVEQVTQTAANTNASVVSLDKFVTVLQNRCYEALVTDFEEPVDIELLTSCRYSI